MKSIGVKRRRDRIPYPALALMAVAAISSPGIAWANINLELRPSAQTVNVSDPADLGLYAVSDNAIDQFMSAADILFTWDPNYLQLLFNDNTGATPSLFSGFPASDPWGNINGGQDPPTGGTGYYAIYANFGSPIAATPAGTLLTTFALDALAPTPATFFTIVLNAGNGGETKVYDGFTENLNVTGTLGQAQVEIVPEPACIGLVGLAMLMIRTRRRP